MGTFFPGPLKDNGIAGRLRMACLEGEAASASQSKANQGLGWGFQWLPGKNIDDLKLQA